MSVVRPGLARSDFRVGAAPCALLFLVALLQEIDADLVAVDPTELAAAVGEAGGRQQQEEFLQVQALDGAVDREFGAGLRNVFHRAFTPPGAVDAHHMRGDPTLECDALALAPFCHQWFAPALKAAGPAFRAGLSDRLRLTWLTTGKLRDWRRHVGGIPFPEPRQCRMRQRAGEI